VAYCEITYERDGPKAPTTVHGPLGITCHQNEKANVIAYCLEHRFTSHDLCGKNYERQVETTVKALFTYVDNALEKVKPCDVYKLASDTFISSLPLAVLFSGVLEGSKSYNITETW
jgi:hypothetical protein